MGITVTKILPTSSWYAGTGSVTITLSGINSITVNSKKSLIKTQVPQSSTTYNGTASSDRGYNFVKDLKKVEDNIKIRGWLVDTTASSAWTQAWRLRGMESSGGPVSSLVIEDLTFGTGSQQAFLEQVNFIAYPARTLGLTINNTSNASMGKTRIECDLDFYLGNAR
jgi:hypothetical protein